MAQTTLEFQKLQAFTLGVTILKELLFLSDRPVAIPMRKDSLNALAFRIRIVAIFARGASPLFSARAGGRNRVPLA